MEKPELVVISGSPHLGGSTEKLVFNWLGSVRDEFFLVQLSQTNFYPCLGCQQCMESNSLGECVFGPKDEVNFVFSKLALGQKVVLFAPIYFYHLPGKLKSFLDRAQSFYALKIHKRLKTNSGKLKVVLLAGRSKGEKLFSGAELTLTYFAKIFDLEVTCLNLRGIDSPKDVSPAVLERVFSFLLG
ncbi:MAG: NAD(P)H-dependent oxidoreductase [Desulfonauticus sp.]|nr:NAD(P)H-dependent oxidoreductase [Desulfonauticus sp.]